MRSSTGFTGGGRAPARHRALVAVGAGLLAGVASAAGAVVLRRMTTGRIAGPGGSIHAHGEVTVRGTPEQVYARWRDLPRLPDVLSHLREVRVLDPQRSRWTAVGPDNKPITWDVEITDDVPGRELAWRSLPPAAVPTEGHVRFTPARGGKGTEVHLDLSYSPPADGATEATVFEAAQERQIRRDLRRFKRTVNAG